MSNRHLFLPSGFPKAPLANGVGRQMCQLKRVVLKYCKSDGGSRGLRDFLEHDLLHFATQHPSVVVYVKPRRKRAPIIKAEFCNGNDFWMDLKNLPREEILKWLHLCTTMSDGTELRLRKYLHTDHPSIQGPWTPFTHRNPHLNTTSFPDERLSQPVFIPKSATDKLIEMFQEQLHAEQGTIEEKRAE